MAEQRKQAEILTTPNCYLRTRWMESWIPPLAVLLLLAGALSWFFFGSCVETVSGWAQVNEGRFVDCAVPSSEISRIKVGQIMMVGNNSGPIIHVASDYVTYRQVAELYGYSVTRMHLSENEVYYYVRATVPNEATGYRQYTIVTGTETPFRKYFGERADE